MTNPIKDALAHLRAGKHQEAASLLQCEFDKNTNRLELARIANMISPCGMIAEAIVELTRMDGAIEEYQAAPPRDEDIGQTVKLACLAGA